MSGPLKKKAKTDCIMEKMQIGSGAAAAAGAAGAAGGGGVGVYVQTLN